MRTRQVFEASSALPAHASFPFHVEEPDKVYRFTCFDTGKVMSAPGTRLIEAGFEVELEERPGSAVFVYEYGS